MKSSRRRILTVAGLFVASLFCVALVVVRNIHTGNGNFRFLIWNLFLAWIPFLLAVLVYDPAVEREDFQMRDDATFMKHTMAYREVGPDGVPTVRLDYKPVIVTRYQPMERKY